MTDCLLSERRGDIAILTLNRPHRRNALNIDLCRAIKAAAEDAVDDGARAIVITGTGSSFCSGADLSEVYGQEFIEALYAMLHGLSQLTVPLIAAVNGPAVGGGAQLSIACDLRMADATASFGIPTAKNALAVDSWTIQTLTGLTGQGLARRMLLAAETINAETAVRLGLADRSGDLDAAITWAEQIATFAPLTLAYTKRLLNGWADAEETATRYAEVWSSRDADEAAQAWREKRSPHFSGE